MFKGNEPSQFHLKTTPASYKFALPLQISFMMHLAKIFYIEGKLSSYSASNLTFQLQKYCHMIKQNHS